MHSIINRFEKCKKGKKTKTKSWIGFKFCAPRSKNFHEKWLSVMFQCVELRVKKNCIRFFWFLWFRFAFNLHFTELYEVLQCAVLQCLLFCINANSFFGISTASQLLHYTSKLQHKIHTLAECHECIAPNYNFSGVTISENGRRHCEHITANIFIVNNLKCTRRKSKWKHFSTWNWWFFLKKNYGAILCYFVFEAFCRYCFVQNENSVDLNQFYILASHFVWAPV